MNKLLWKFSFNFDLCYIEVQWFNFSKPTLKILYLHTWHLYLFGTRLAAILFIYLFFRLCQMMAWNVIGASTMKLYFCNPLFPHLYEVVKNCREQYIRKKRAPNALSQSDYMIFKSTISLEQNDEKTWLHTYIHTYPVYRLLSLKQGLDACWNKFMEIKSVFKNIWVGLVENGCGHCGLRALQLTYAKKELI